MTIASYHFFLGGNDLEMEAIRQLLTHKGISDSCIHDKHLGWGARASDYADELKTLPKQAKAVLIELENDLNLNEQQVIILDHHGSHAGADKPTALEQLWRLLEMPPNQWGKEPFADFPLIVANDKGYIPAMQRMGATPEQITRIRTRDRAAQGITAEQEEQAKTAIEQKRDLLEGKLTIVELPHNRTATVTDRLALDPGYRNLLVISPGEINFYGQGSLIACLNKHFPGGWYGGELPKNGYWGIAGETPRAEDVEAVLSDALSPGPSPESGRGEKRE